MDQQKPSSPMAGMRGALYLVLFVAQSFAVPGELLLRRWGSFGSRYFGMQTLAGMASIPLWAIAWPEHDTRPLLWLWWLMLGLLAAARLVSAAHERRGPLRHSRYNGAPWLARRSRRSEPAIKGGLEPVVLFTGGSLLLAWSEPVGSYLMASATGLLISSGLAEQVARERARAMNDALIEQQDAMERFRAMRRDD